MYQTGGGILLLTKNEYTVSDKGEQITVELNSNFDFDVKMPQVDWITTTVTRSVSSHTLYYTVTPNETYDKREAEIIYYDRNDKSVADTLKNCPGAERCRYCCRKRNTILQQKERL